MRIALTGGIASGKSLVAGLLAERGIPIIDADAIAHELATPGSKLVQELAGALGPWVIGADGALDRNALRERAFADSNVRRTLERISHPAIRAEMDQRAARLEVGVPYVLLVIPLLVEAAWHDAADEVVVVDCPIALQTARLLEHRGMARALIDGILAAQADRNERLEIADHVIVNDGDLDQLARDTLALHAKLTARSDEAV
jgi:dephospho-CoA kinase